jgi:hypothetical protein
MIISHARKFAIFAPWKTASSTVDARFGDMNESPYSRFYYFSPHLNRVTHQHVTCAEFEAMPESRLGYATVAFTRNPYDRVYSGFIQVQRDIVRQSAVGYPTRWIGELVMRQLDANRRQLERANYNVDEWIASLAEDQIYNVGHNTSLPLHPAHYWTHLAGSRHVSIIGRVETFEDDLESICDRLGVQPPERQNRNVSDSAAGAGGAGPYRHAGRMNARSIARINDLFADDFALLGYDRL